MSRQCFWSVNYLNHKDAIGRLRNCWGFLREFPEQDLLNNYNFGRLLTVEELWPVEKDGGEGEDTVEGVELLRTIVASPGDQAEGVP